MIARVVGLLLLLFAASTALAGSPMHPEVTLLDREGEKVLKSGKPVSLKETCGSCHDTEYIAKHSYHSQVGADEAYPAGKVPGGRPWDTSAGMFGRWDPLAYRRLAPGDLDLDGWTRTFAPRHVGGGPSPVEMNCLLCHMRNPANDRRVEAIRKGQYEWASTATLAGTGLVVADGNGWRYVKEKFGKDGQVPRNSQRLGDPLNANCAICHSLEHTGPDPLVFRLPEAPRDTRTTGQIFSSALVSDSGLNLAGKEDLRRPWDVHAERMLTCTDCHHSNNNPLNFAQSERSRPEHLSYDARRLSIGEYLLRPSHDFTKGESAQGNVARQLDGSMRRCEGCHDALPRHERWLPNASRHLSVMLCESCHIPRIPVGALRQVDWTVLGPDQGAVVAWRGIAGDAKDSTVFQEGYEPVILPRHQKNGEIRHGPHNLVTFWYWTGGDPPGPVSLKLLRKAWSGDAGEPDPKLVAVLDTDGDGKLSKSELRLDTVAKVDAMRARLLAVGVTDPKIEGLIQPYSLHHAVVSTSFATRKCEACHTKDSRLTRAFPLSSHVPPGATAVLVADTNVRMPGKTCTQEGGKLCYLPVPTASGRYVIGHDRAGWIDLAGVLLMLGTIGGVAVHGGIRVLAARRRGRS